MKLSSVHNKVWEYVQTPVWCEIFRRTSEDALEPVRGQVFNQLRERIWRRVNDPVWRQVDEELSKR